MSERLRTQKGLNTPEIEFYNQAMHKAAVEKMEQIEPCLVDMDQGLSWLCLSVGAGTGGLEDEFEINFPKSRMVAMDLSLPMLEAIDNGLANLESTTRTRSRIKLVQADAMKLPFARDLFDLVLMSGLDHEIWTYDKISPYRLDAWERFFTEMGRAVKVGG